MQKEKERERTNKHNCYQIISKYGSNGSAAIHMFFFFFAKLHNLAEKNNLKIDIGEKEKRI